MNQFSSTFLLLFTVDFYFFSTVRSIINSTAQSTEFEPMVVPSMVEVCSGSSASINCTFPHKMLKVSWHINQTTKKIDMSSSNDTLHSHYHEKKGETWSVLTIQNVTVDDIGYYYCKVTQDIPVLKSSISEPSHLRIKDNQEETTQTSCTTERPQSALADWWVWIAAASGCAVLIICLVVTAFICCRRKEGPIYENTEVVKRYLQNDRSPRLAMPTDNSKLSKLRDSVKSHNYVISKTGNRTSKVKRDK